MMRSYCTSLDCPYHDEYSKSVTGLAWAQRLVREAPTIATLTPSELAGLRAMIYRHEIPEVPKEATEQDG